MTVRSTVLKNLIYPSIDLIKGTRIVSTYRFLQKSQWWNKEKIESLQNEKLRKLIHYSYNNVLYYRNLFQENNLKPSDIKDINDLEKIPPLNGKLVRKYYNSQLISKNISPKKLLQGRTGGSTGEPLQFYRDKNTKSWGLSSLYRSWNWAGLEFAGEKFHFMGGSLGGFLIDKSKKHMKLNRYITGNISFSAFDMTIDDLEKYTSLMEKNTKIRFLRGFPSAMYILANYINNQNITINNIDGILTTGEKLFAFQREEIQKAFQCKVFDQYACGEIYGIAAQCEEAELYHISDEHVIVENDNSTKTSAVTVTDLDNFAMPLIRYQNGDLVRFSTKKCACGRELSVISEIEGREHDFITTPNGHLIVGNFFPHLFQPIKGIDQYSITQETLELLKIKIKPNSRFSQQELDTYLDKIHEYMGESMEIIVDLVDEIPLPDSGKRIFVKSKIKPDFNDNF